MESGKNSNYYHTSLSPPFISSVKSNHIRLGRLSVKQERNLLKVFLLWHFYQLFNQYYEDQLRCGEYGNYNQITERYIMDCRIIQFVINEIIQTGEYTLEGIANYTRVPLDVITDAACGNNAYPSATVLMGIIGLYVQVRPDMFQELLKKILAMKDEKNGLTISVVLNEQ